MVFSRKRGRQEIEPAEEQVRELSLIERIRNMWEFANLNQWIYIFGRAAKVNEKVDIEEFEVECLKSNSIVLPEVGLALLKLVSSHRGLTLELFDEYTRRQYVAKAPQRNPFGTEEEPAKFNDFDIFTKLRVLQQLTQWIMVNPDRIRERMEESKDSEQVSWRIEPFGWDAEDRTYFLLDDNRLYRMAEPPPPAPSPAKPKKNSKKAKAAIRASKRRKIAEATESMRDTPEAELDQITSIEEDGLGGCKWECVAIKLDEMNAFLHTINASRNPNEKNLRKQISDQVLPILEKQEESQKRKAAQKERDLLNAEKLASAKRSSRIAGKLEQQKLEEETREVERKQRHEVSTAKKEQEKWLKLEHERESRMMTREQRVREREARRKLHEGELVNLSEDSKKIENGDTRLSERQLKAEIEKKKQALEKLEEEEDDWIFDCICGAYGQIDDGTHSIACEKCSIWLHSKCVGVSILQADRDDFHFICPTCKRRAEEEERTKSHSAIKIKLNHTWKETSISPTATMPNINGNMDPTSSQHAQSFRKSSVVPQMHVFQTGGHHQSTQNSEMGNISRPPESHSMNQSFSLSPNQPQQVPGTDPKQIVETSNPCVNEYTSIYPPKSLGQPTGADVHFVSKPQQVHSSRLSPFQILSDTPINGFSTPYLQQNPSHSSAVTPNTMLTQSVTTSPQRPGVNHEERRRSSLEHSSPILRGPILTPVNYKPNKSTPPSANFSPKAQLSKASDSPLTSLAETQPLRNNQDSQGRNQSSALPPAITGLSPTKHSPPRPAALAGIIEQATPSIIPPVASLTPSPQMQNLTPPVKSSSPASTYHIDAHTSLSF